MSGVTLDAGPLIQLDRNDRTVIALLAVANETGAPIVIPGTALAQAIRNPSRQARLGRLVRQPRTDVVALFSGQLNANAGTFFRIEGKAAL